MNQFTSNILGTEGSGPRVWLIDVNPSDCKLLHVLLLIAQQQPINILGAIRLPMRSS